MVEVPLKDWSKKPPKCLDADPCFIRLAQGSQNGVRNLGRGHLGTDFQHLADFKKDGGLLRKTFHMTFLLVVPAGNTM